MKLDQRTRQQKRLTFCLTTAREFVNQAQFHQAIPYYLEVLQYFSQADFSTPGYAQALAELGTAYTGNGEYVLGLEYLNQALTQATTAPDYPATNMTIIYLNLSIICFNTKRVADGTRYFDQALQIECKQHGANSREIAKRYQHMAEICKKLQLEEVSSRYFVRCYSTLRALAEQNSLTRAKYSTKLSLLYLDNNNLTHSLALAKEALAIYEYLKNQNQGDYLLETYQLHRTIGQIALSRNQFSSCHHHYSLAYNHVKEYFGSESHPELAGPCYQLGTYYQKINNLEQAMCFQKRAVELSEAKSDHQSQAFHYTMLGDIYAADHKEQDAKNAYEHTVQLISEEKENEILKYAKNKLYDFMIAEAKSCIKQAEDHESTNKNQSVTLYRRAISILKNTRYYPERNGKFIRYCQQRIYNLNNSNLSQAYKYLAILKPSIIIRKTEEKKLIQKQL
ncbi:MAG: tetratricopeptide repeat protein [Proteobacteria bacterium]|nr:tetratricopeptide repeat protein [Pseudomonadota bacterium]